MAGWSGFGLDNAQTANLVSSLRRTLQHTGIKNPVLRLRTPDCREHQKIVDEAVRAALAGKIEPRLALADAAKRWQELDKSRDFKTRRAEYHYSLSLEPPH